MSGKKDGGSASREKFRIWKNVILVSVSFMCLLTAYNLVATLQSTINRLAGLGNTSQAVLFVSMIISTLFIPTIMIQKFGLKWTMVISQMGYSIYIATQFYPSFVTLIPAAAIVGFGAAPLLSAQSSYLTQMGVKLASLAGRNEEETKESSISRVFGVSFMISQSSTIWGNLIGSTVLSFTAHKPISDDMNFNETDSIVNSHCGANFCHSEAEKIPDPTNFSSSAWTKTEHEPNIPMLMGILLAITLLATLILVFLVDPTPIEEMKSSRGNGKTSGQMLIATFSQLKDPYQLLIIPLTLWAGFDRAFLSADFTYAFITCSWGVENIGYVLMCYGTSASISSFVFGYLIKKIGRIPIFVLGFVISLTLLLVMQFVWHPDPSKPEFYFIVSAFWGSTNAIWTTQLSTFYGVLFGIKKEASAGFSNYRLWQALGWVIPLAYSTFLCVRIKLFILMGILTIGMMGYLTIEVSEYKKTRRRPSPRNSRRNSEVKVKDWSYITVAPREDKSVATNEE